MTNDPIFRHQLYKVSQWGEIIFKDELIFFVQFWILTRVFMKQINYEKIKTDLEKLLQVYENKNTESPCLMRLLVLGKIRISQMFGLYDLPNANFGLFISLVRCFG